jgi:hypothetical protein
MVGLMMEKYWQKIKAATSSNKFFYLILGLFVVSASWIALSGRYPMAFDENYHYGIIQQYAKQWSPFFAHAPAGSEAFGDITRYPSYLFHYLMSFPYRLLSEFIHSDPIKIIILRFINIAFLTVGLVLFKKIFDYIKISRSVANLSLLFFVLIPVVPFLAAQINYDNLLIPLSAGAVLLTLKFRDSLNQHKFDSISLLYLGIICLFTSVVKYTFLPIFAGLGLYILYRLFLAMQRDKLKIFKDFFEGFKQISAPLKIVLIVATVLGLGLFGERYGVNVAKYHTPVPDCNQVLSVSSCLHYGPWARDYMLINQKTGPAEWNAVRYSGQWLNQSMYELFFAINQDYLVRPPMPVLLVTAWGVAIAGFALIVAFWKKIKTNQNLTFFAFLSVVYVLVLWADNYHRYTTVNWPVAIHGRYLLPLLPFMFVLIAQAFAYLFSKYKTLQVSFKTPLLMLVALIMLQGGAITYIVRSDSSWQWQNSLVVNANNGARAVLTKFIIH